MSLRLGKAPEESRTVTDDLRIAQQGRMELVRFVVGRHTTLRIHNPGTLLPPRAQQSSKRTRRRTDGITDGTIRGSNLLPVEKTDDSLKSSVHVLPQFRELA